MTKTLFVGALVAALSVPSVALAQRAPGAMAERGAGAQMRAEHGVPFLHLREELQLTPQQVAQLESIAARLREQNRPLMEQMRAAGAGHQRGAMQQRMERMTPEQRAEMRQRMQQMTPEQRAQMRSQRQGQRGQMHERVERMTPEQRAEMRQRMGQMTPEQRAQMRGQRQGQRGAGARGGSGLPAELQPVAAQIRQNHAAAMQAAREVLTAQQQERARQLMRERSGPRGRN